MRRLLAVLLLVPVFSVPTGAEPPGGRAVAHEAGRLTLSPAGDEERLHRRLEEAATGPLAKQVLRAYDVAMAKGAAAGGSPTYRLRELFPVADLDGDKVGDILHYEARFQASRGVPKGDVTLAVYSGRTGARRWRKTLSGMAIAFPFEGRVGAAGKAGLLMVRPYDVNGDFRDDAYRIVGIGGARGDKVYDRTVSEKDGLGDVQWGGLLNAVSGGGTEILIGRLKTGAVLVKDWLRAETSTPYVVDGKDGKVRALGAGTPAVTSMTGFLAAGDLNADGRDDVVGIRRLEAETGTVTAFSSADGLPLWTSPPVTIGWGIRVSGVADMAGDKRRDLLLESWVGPEGLLEIEDVTDGVPMVDQQATVHGILFDAAGLLQWDRADGVAYYLPVGDIDRDGKTDVLSVATLRGDQDGLRFTAVNGADKVLYQRAVTVRAARGREQLFTDIAYQGDLDGDRVADYAFIVVSLSRFDFAMDFGFFLAGRNQVAREDGFGLRGTLDGRGDEFVLGRRQGDGAVITVRDGVRGRTYWTARITRAAGTGWRVGALPGTRGKCGGVLLVGVSESTLWLTALDGATGRPRWTRAVEGQKPRARVTASGAPARCR